MSNRNGVWSLPAQYQAIADQDWTMALGAPTGVSATAGNAQAEVSFTAPTFAGIPGTITQFKVTSSSGQTATGSASPITVTGLTNGSGVTFTAQAQNAIGLGKASDASSSVTPLAEVISGLFSTHLYDGTGSAQTITNNINLSGKGGLVWLKARTDANEEHNLYDTVRGATKRLISHESFAESTESQALTSFNSNGFSVGTANMANKSGDDFVSWTFRKQSKFFDIVQYSGNGSAQTLSHNLGSTPGMIIVKRTDSAGAWRVFHRSLGETKTLTLQTTGAEVTSSVYWNDTAPTSTQFTIGTDSSDNGATYIAYLFAHNNNDGGFGPDSEDIIKCGTFNSDGSGKGSVTLGFEPQFVMAKVASRTGNWNIFDTMRGYVNTSGNDDAWLEANTSDAESSYQWGNPTTTGFEFDGGYTSQTYIYMAIRRPDQSVPTSASDVFAIDTGDGNGSSTVQQFTSGFPVDFAYLRPVGESAGNNFYSRLTGNRYLVANSTAAEATPASDASNYKFDSNTGWYFGGLTNYVSWMWKRARGFFDVVTYTGTGSATTINHNLGVAPEMIWLKSRDSAENWQVGADVLTGTWERIVYLNRTDGEGTSSAVWWNSTAPTSSVFSIGTQDMNNKSGDDYIALLFASITGISKIGSYTGDGTTDGSKVIDCGFAPKFILIKKVINGSGNWRIYDTERGIPTGGDPALLFNQTDAQSSTADSIDTTSSGFTVIDGNTNANNDGYLFFKIA